ncbi:tRNA CCA-pyrophosphorylase [Buchnera aphidicola]|uniref:CCA-adding enzyme n=1 Tax=Buchnera aphidicola (Anoecia oenotherae) TaxID=1241833 RepID=A0A4D6XXI7_9GAMM|nr:tRNA CCA-pyrophosphorylase [Buchnera aphidicola]QCI19188.1 tRNA CCA-pyrophosphorylase [Buchnera aphidicola (Anoecia oenotherae)]
MKIYLVGGAIRNSFLNLPVTDKDWVIVGSTPEVLIKKKFKQVGKDFPVFLHPITREEYCLARTERKSGHGYKDFNIDYSQHVTLKEDLMRRDLTINAIAQDEYGKYIDPFNGFKDLKNRVLKHISSSFQEDPLRVLRVARFAASLSHLGFYIDKNTMKFMQKIVLSKEILFLTKDRIWKETEKAMKTHNPHVYFKILQNCLAFPILFPELNKIINTNFLKFYSYSFLPFSLEENLYTSLAYIAKKNNSVQLRLAYMFLTTSYYFPLDLIEIKHHMNKSLYIHLVKNFCIRLNLPIKIKKLILIIIKNNIFLLNIEKKSSSSIINFLNTIDAWRKPKQINQITLLIKTYIRFIYKNNNIKFIKIKKNYLQKIYSIVCSPPIELILKQGYKGKEIKMSINKWRINTLDNWKKNKNINY